jgi:hypothetical protein
MLTRLHVKCGLALTALGLTGLVAMSSPVNAASTTSSTPSVLTPYCKVLVTGQSIGQEQCSATQAQMTSQISATQTVYAVDYMNANYGGASLSWVVSGIFHCTSYPQLTASSMPSGWNDVISSYRDFVSCSSNPHYENNNYKGTVVNCGPNCSYVGAAMNDRTSSEKWGS